MTTKCLDVLLETVNYCNLLCPACPWHSTMTREKRKMQPEEYAQIFQQISPYAKSIVFYVMGEPLLNEHIFDYVKTAHAQRIRTGVSTNGMLLENHIEDVFSSGLDFIQIALDGLDRQTHESYRVGSDFQKVVSNLRLLALEKSKRGSATPEIRIQTLITRQNEHQIASLKSFAGELGAGFSAKRMMFGKTEEIIRKNRKVFEPIQKHHRRLNNPDLLYFKNMPVCPQSETLTILCNGDVVPCCYDYDGKVVLGNLLRQSLPEILQGTAKKEFDHDRLIGKAELCSSCDMATEIKIKVPRAVLFDYGRTLVIMPDIDIRKGISFLLKALGVKHDPEFVEEYYEERQRFIAQMCPDKKRRMIYPETMVMRHMFEIFHIHSDKTWEELERIFSDGCSLGKPVEGSTELLRTLRRMGIRTGVVTNNRYSAKTIQWNLARLFPDHQFDLILSSTDLGYHKPDSRIFQKALLDLQLEPSGVWFAGDGLEDDVEGATNAGMEAFWFVKHAKLVEAADAHCDFASVLQEWKEMESLLVEYNRTEKENKQ